MATAEGQPIVKEHDLVLLGGSSASISAVIAELSVDLQYQYKRIFHVATWEDLATE